ncbi:hypothetical protein PVAND_006108 [Polypedilum vanderplanki]|uniref:Uncharacterized protein n=1 Tax=Polypedilum vanderplanki TaxID=319348 RepID=A0A9J6C253_POLVA|nr:hypothetical protein PVAND_006108 [Polypedilum vanderplanki]
MRENTKMTEECQFQHDIIQQIEITMMIDITREIVIDEEVDREVEVEVRSQHHNNRRNNNYYNNSSSRQIITEKTKIIQILTFRSTKIGAARYKLYDKDLDVKLKVRPIVRIEREDRVDDLLKKYN